MEVRGGRSGLDRGAQARQRCRVSTARLRSDLWLALAAHICGSHDGYVGASECWGKRGDASKPARVLVASARAYRDVGVRYSSYVIDGMSWAISTRS